MPVIDHFSIFAPYYESFITPKYPQELLTHLNPSKSGPLLDAGGGTGRIAQFLCTIANPVVVADLSPMMLLHAHEKIGLCPVRLHSEILPFPNDTFEYIIMVDALHHVCNQSHTLAELWRTLKPGGRLVIEEPDNRHFRVKLLALAEKLGMMRSHFLSPIQISNFLQFPNAVVRIETGGFNAWIIVEKLLK